MDDENAWDSAWAEHCVRRLIPEGADTLMIMLGLADGEKIVSVKYCPRCKEAKPKTGYYKAVGRPDNLATYCRPCQAEYNKECRQKVRVRRQKNEQ